jgi:2-oxo-3-hexenedioate decarboxylase
MPNIEAIADRIMAAGEAGAQIAPVSDDDTDFDIAAAYATGAEIMRRRIASGERQTGWKIGFTNRTIWPEYGIYAPIFGPMYHTTIHEMPHTEPIPGSLHGLTEPRIEAEIAFRLARPPEPGMKPAAILECIDGVAPGFEIVRSIYPGWKFRIADAIAAFGMHGRFYHAPFALISDPAQRGEWLPALETFEMELTQGGATVDRGKAQNVLDGPLHALGHFVTEYDRVFGARLRPGDVVTTGTVTRAFPVKPGETWSLRVHGMLMPELTIRF